MRKEYVDIIKHDPNFKTLVKKRSRFGWMLTLFVLIVYFSYILTIAFYPSALGIALREGSVTTIGIPIGVSIIIFAFVLTGIYVRRANSEFDDLSEKIKRNVKEKCHV